MSMNGISPYSYSTYGANPYAVPNYSQQSFQGNSTSETTTAPVEKKSNTGKVIIGLGAAAAAVATGIVAFKRGKLINGESSKLIKNIGDGLKSIFTKQGRTAFATIKENQMANKLLNAALGNQEINTNLLDKLISSRIKKQQHGASPQKISESIEIMKKQLMNGDAIDNGKLIDYAEKVADRTAKALA